jgi:hypothetical protein
VVIYVCVYTYVNVSQLQWFKPIILATWETERVTITIQGQLRQKVQAIPSQPMAGCNGWCAWHPRATWGNTNRRITVWAGPG